MSETGGEFGNGFDQNRKEWADALKPKLRGLLAEHYDVQRRCVVSAENTVDGEYDSSSLDAIQLMDYAGVDWVVQTDDMILTVGERVRKSGGSFTLRSDNANSKPCERDLLPTAVRNGGLYPNHFLFVRRNGFSYERAYLLDTEKMVRGIESEDIPLVASGRNDDGTAWEAYDLPDIVLQGCVINSWVKDE